MRIALLSGRSSSVKDYFCRCWEHVLTLHRHRCGQAPVFLWRSMHVTFIEMSVEELVYDASRWLSSVTDINTLNGFIKRTHWSGQYSAYSTRSPAMLLVIHFKLSTCETERLASAVSSFSSLPINCSSLTTPLMKTTCDDLKSDPNPLIKSATPFAN